MKHVIYKVIGLFLLLVAGNITYIHGESIDSTTIDNFDVSNATNSIKDLKGSIDTITEELFALDEKQRTEDGISDQYKETRNEIVNVINSINTTTENVNKILQQIVLINYVFIKERVFDFLLFLFV